MTHINPLAIVLIGFCTVIGALLGVALLGLAIGLGIVLVSSYLG